MRSAKTGMNVRKGDWVNTISVMYWLDIIYDCMM